MCNKLKGMESLLVFGVAVLHLVPLILAFYIPALMGMALLKERGESYELKAVVVFVVGFGAIIALQIFLRSLSTVQTLETVGLSLVQIAFALFLAFLTVYKLAD